VLAGVVSKGSKTHFEQTQQNPFPNLPIWRFGKASEEAQRKTRRNDELTPSSGHAEACIGWSLLLFLRGLTRFRGVLRRI
jgi:hypothetical protein